MQDKHGLFSLFGTVKARTLRASGGVGWQVWSFCAVSALAIGIAGYSAVSLQQQAAEASNHIHGKSKPVALTAMKEAQAALGYEGFLGGLQKFLTVPNIQGATEMRTQLNAAEQAVMTLAATDDRNVDFHLPTWQAIVELYKQNLSRVEQVLGTGQAPNVALLTPLYTAHQNLAAILSQVENDYTRIDQQALENANRQLSTLVWMVLFGSIIVVVGSWLTLRTGFSAPLATLRAALQDPLVMDRDRPLWGIDRGDAVGELARAIETLRSKLLTMPDMVVETADGAMPLKFSGPARSVFEALTNDLTRAVQDVREADLPERLRTIELLCKGLAGTVAATHEELRTSTDNIGKVSAEIEAQGIGHATRVDELIGALKDRTEAVAEMARLTGGQVQSGLRDIVGAQVQLKLSASQAAQLVDKYAGNVDALSERMQAGTNLLRSSGKVLQETVDSVRTRMMDATSALTQTDARLTSVVEDNHRRLSSLTEQAEVMLNRGTEGQEALSSIAEAGQRITQTAERLTMSEGDLTRAVASMLSQSKEFLPLADQLRQMHQQLTQSLAHQSAAQDKMLIRLEEQADQLESATSRIHTAPLEDSLKKLSHVGRLTESLADILTHVETAAPQLGQLDVVLTRMSAINTESIDKLRTSLEQNTETTEMNALRVNANLQLVRDQIGDLLASLTAEQAQLMAHIETAQRSFNQMRHYRPEPLESKPAAPVPTVAEIEDALARQTARLREDVVASVRNAVESMPVPEVHVPEITLPEIKLPEIKIPEVQVAASGPSLDEISAMVDRSYQRYTGQLTSFLSQFEQALAGIGDSAGAPMQDAEDAEVSPVARAILSRLRGGAGGQTSAAAVSMNDAVSRMGQIKKLTSALARQSQTVAEIATGQDLSDVGALAEQAKRLISEVMEAISDLSSTAETITETADRLSREA